MAKINSSDIKKILIIGVPEHLGTDKIADPVKDIEDHLPEMTRYACMTRPMKPKIKLVPDTGSFQAERRKMIKARQMAARKGISIGQAYGRIR